ncbi:MAG: hypothetical protein ABSD30_05620 [Candidatus Binatus sp.]
MTGAASGIGRRTAIRFVGDGAAVLIADLIEEGAVERRGTISPMFTL